jgi:hypothetical protein
MQVIVGCSSWKSYVPRRFKEPKETRLGVYVRPKTPKFVNSRRFLIERNHGAE